MQNQTSKVLALYIADADQSAMISKDFVQCRLDGIEGDKHYAKDPARSVLITSTYAYMLAKKQGIDVSYGALGENILIDFDLRPFGPGTRLQMGDVILEIAQNCTLCNHLSKIDRKLPKLLRNDRGVFARVVQEGRIHTGDEVSLVE